MTFCFHRLQYTGYPPKLTTCILPHPITNFLKFDTLSPGGRCIYNLPSYPFKLSPSNLSVRGVYLQCPAPTVPPGYAYEFSVFTFHTFKIRVTATFFRCNGRLDGAARSHSLQTVSAIMIPRREDITNTGV